MGQKFGVNNRKAGKVTAVMVEQMRRDYELGATQRELAEVSGLSVVQVGRIVRGESWKDTGVARGFVDRKAWEAIVRGERGRGEETWRGTPAEERGIAESLERVREMVRMEEDWRGEFQEEKGLVGTVPEGIVERMRALLGKEERELGPVGVEELPVGNGWAGKLD